MNHNFVLKAKQVLYVKYWKQSSNLKHRHKNMQQKLLICSELMNGKYRTVLQK